MSNTHSCVQLMKRFLIRLFYRLVYRFDQTGKVVKIPNLAKKTINNDFYYGVEVLTIDRGKEYLLLTKKEYETGLERAQKNAEVLPKEQPYTER